MYNVINEDGAKGLTLKTHFSTFGLRRRSRIYSNGDTKVFEKMESGTEIGVCVSPSFEFAGRAWGKDD